MITLLGSPRRCCDGLTRRETLRAGALSLLGGGFSLPRFFAAEDQALARRGRPGKAKSVILLYLLGGAATQDMWDMKPNAPADPWSVRTTHHFFSALSRNSNNALVVGSSGRPRSALILL